MKVERREFIVPMGITYLPFCINEIHASAFHTSKANYPKGRINGHALLLGFLNARRWCPLDIFNEFENRLGIAR